MLNRRTLRIKAMQSIFAFEQGKEANFNLALEEIANSFLPDLNSMEVQDKDLLKSQAKEAATLFKKEYSRKKNVKSSDSEKINAIVSKAIKGYYDQLKKDSLFLKKEMLKDAEKIFDRYTWLLYWLEAVKGLISDRRPKVGADSFENLVNNQVINLILEHKKLSSTFIKTGLTWQDQSDELMVWVNEVLLKDEEVIKYLEFKTTSFEEDREVLLYIYKSLIFKNEIIGLFMEQNDLYWAENKAILRSMVVKTLKTVEEDSSEFDLAELSYNWQEDKEFFETIFNETVNEGGKYEELIGNKSKNWDLDRISDTDKILLLMAIQEMINFPGIPLKVTINEYIEVSKKYSTPKSKQFINGVLDVIALDLQEEGVIKKSGRGLIDNK